MAVEDSTSFLNTERKKIEKDITNLQLNETNLMTNIMENCKGIEELKEDVKV